MIKEDVKHLFDRSACLTKKQFEAYLQGNMITEEVYAIEHHINGCPLCSMAMDGMQLRKDALVVANQMNTDFLADHLSALPPQSTSSAASYVKSLKPKEISTKPLITGVKVLVAIGACAGILWFVQSVGKNNANTKTEEPQEEVVNVATPPKQEEQSVVIEEPLIAEQPVAEEPLEEVAPVTEQPVIGPPEDKPKPVVTTPAKPAAVPATTAKPPVTTAKPPVTTAKPTVPPPTPVKPPVTKPAPPVVNQEEPKAEPPKPVVREEPIPQPKVEQPAPKKEPVEELPNDPIAAGKALMDKRSYNAAINRMRSEMRSSNKARRQEAVILVAKCYQQLGNKERAAELLKSVVDEGGPEKKNAKKLLKEVDKNAKDDKE